MIRYIEEIEEEPSNYLDVYSFKQILTLRGSMPRKFHAQESRTGKAMRKFI
jgi:hypothetical protein